jgi:hypothetical protein
VLNKIKDSIKDLIKVYKNDPVKRCGVYKNIGCSHVDGPACFFPDCKEFKEWNCFINGE